MAAAAAQSSPARRLESPQLDEIARADGPIPDSLITAPKTQALALAPTGYWGGVYRASTGENVTVYASNAYPVDSALGQRWADFLASLVHGSELSKVTVMLSTPSEISRVCGQDALACYSARGALLYAPGEDPSSSLSAEAVITHEYGHHVAANRNNAPWDAVVTEISEVGTSAFAFAGKEIAQLVGLDPMLAIVEVSERKVGHIKVGDMAEVRLVSGETRQGRIRYVSRSAVAATRTYRVEVELPNSDYAIPDGITAEVTIPLAPVPASRVPRSALIFSSA